MRPGMRAYEFLRRKIKSLEDTIRPHPYVSLSLFVIIVVAVSVAGYARYQHVQAEIAAQQTIPARIQRAFISWRDDLSMRLSRLQDSIQGTVEDAGRVIGGGLGIVSYIVTAVLDFIGNLHIMIPVLVLYVGVGFFGTLKMRVATLLGAIVAFWLSTSSGIVQGSIIGLLVIVALLLLNKIDPRLLTRIQELLAKIKAQFQQGRTGIKGFPADESEKVNKTQDSLA